MIDDSLSEDDDRLEFVLSGSVGGQVNDKLHPCGSAMWILSSPKTRRETAFDRTFLEPLRFPSDADRSGDSEPAEPNR